VTFLVLDNDINGIDIQIPVMLNPYENLLYDFLSGF